MNWNALCIAGLLLISPVALAQDNSAAGGSDDESTSASQERYGLAGLFEPGFNETNKASFESMVAQFNGRVTPYQEFEEQVLFGVDELHSLDKCEQLEDVLKDQEYVDKVEDCRLTRNADGSPPKSEDEQRAEEEAQEQAEKEAAEQRQAEEDAAKERQEAEEDAQKEAEREAEDNQDRQEEAAKCEAEEDREDKEECFEDYCEDPHPNHAEPCQKFLQNRDQQEERQESQEEFQTCKEGASTAAQRRECAEEYADDVQDDDRWERESKIYEAKQNGKVGARAIVRAAGADAATTATDVEEYDVMVNVVTQNAKARDENVDFRVTVSAELLEGRTIVLDVDPEVLSGPTLVVRYFDVFDDGSETEVIIRQASDLSDVLDPTDDGGQPEYWVVKDANGLQLMASVPHWSVHAITVQGIGEFVSAPSVIAGVIFGVVGSVMAAAVLFKPRKGDDL